MAERRTFLVAFDRDGYVGAFLTAADYRREVAGKHPGARTLVTSWPLDETRPATHVWLVMTMLSRHIVYASNNRDAAAAVHARYVWAGLSDDFDEGESIDVWRQPVGRVHESALLSLPDEAAGDDAALLARLAAPIPGGPIETYLRETEPRETIIGYLVPTNDSTNELSDEPSDGPIDGPTDESARREVEA